MASSPRSSALIICGVEMYARIGGRTRTGSGSRMGRMITAGPDARPTASRWRKPLRRWNSCRAGCTGWAMSRSLAPNSATGISLALGLCAAVWFSSGTRADSIKGALVLGASYLAWRVSRCLVDSAADRVTGPGLAGADLMAEICGALSEFAVYAGLAVAGYAAHWGNTWIIAIAVVIVLAVRRTITACRAGIGAPPAASVQSPPSAPGDAKVWGLGYLLGRALWAAGDRLARMAARGDRRDRADLGCSHRTAGPAGLGDHRHRLRHRRSRPASRCRAGKAGSG